MTLPPSNLYPSPGTWRTSLTKISKTSWTLITDPLPALIETAVPFKVIGNVILPPLNNGAISSSACKVPRVHPVNSSVNVLVISTSNWLFAEKEESVGIPLNPPNGIVNVWLWP